MKKTFKLLTIIALTAIIAFSMIGCDDPKSESGSEVTETNVRNFAANAANTHINLTSPTAYSVVDLPDESRTDVMKIVNPGQWAVALHNLTGKKDKEITIIFSAQVKRVGAAGTLNWQINNSNYPSVGTPINNAPADSWHNMSGQIVITPTNANPALYLSTHENNSGATTYYIDNFTIAIVDGNHPITIAGVIITNPFTGFTANKGQLHEFIAVVEGPAGTAQTVTWSITTAGIHPDTTIDNGYLHVSHDETLSSLIIRATSTADTSKYGEALITISHYYR
jgi:hypothetical protein